MPMPWDPGPIFAHECRSAPRRARTYSGRSAVAAAIFLSILVVWLNDRINSRLTVLQHQARLAENLYFAIAICQLAWALVVAACVSAGSIAIEKARGTLSHLLVTDLSDREIVLGKLAVSLSSVLSLLACTFPVLALASLGMGGIDPEALGWVCLLTVSVAVLGCALGLAFSVLARSRREAIVGTFAVLLLWLLLYPLGIAVRRVGIILSGSVVVAPPEWLLRTNPFSLAVAPYSAHGTIARRDFVQFLLGSFLTSSALVYFAIRRLRRAYVGPTGAGARRAAKRPTTRTSLDALPGPIVDGNPVFWREWHKRRSSRFTRFLWSNFLVAAAIVLSFMLIFPQQRDVAGLVSGGLSFLGLLLLTISAGSSIADDRESGDMDLLLVTPLRARDIVCGTWWASFRVVPVLALLAALGAAGPARVDGRWTPVTLAFVYVFCCGTAICSLGVAMATWTRKPAQAVAHTVLLYLAVAIGVPLLCEAFSASLTVFLASAAMVFALANLFRRYIARAFPRVGRRSALVASIYIAATLFSLNASNVLESGFDWVDIGWRRSAISMVSPIIGIAHPIITVGATRGWPARQCFGTALVWSAGYFSMTIVLLSATIASFDRVLGRFAERTQTASGATGSGLHDALGGPVMVESMT
jgi:ABC-type transport system involved in multi-copper enzyme maturation permease subunit